MSGIYDGPDGSKLYGDGREVEPRDSNSGTVCRHCKEKIIFSLGDWRTKEGFTECGNHEGRLSKAHELAPAEQPRQKSFSQLRGELMSLGDAHMLNKGVPYKSVSPVAASPAEGPRLNTQDYRLAPSGEGPQADEWRNKPHRLIYDLCSEIERLRAAQPSAKVEEIAREIAMLEYQTWNHVPEKVLNNSIKAIAAILRPYFSARPSAQESK